MFQPTLNTHGEVILLLHHSPHVIDDRPHLYQFGVDHLLCYRHIPTVRRDLRCIECGTGVKSQRLVTYSPDCFFERVHPPEKGAVRSLLAALGYLGIQNYADHFIRTLYTYCTPGQDPKWLIFHAKGAPRQ